MRLHRTRLDRRRQRRQQAPQVARAVVGACFSASRPSQVFLARFFLWDLGALAPTQDPEYRLQMRITLSVTGPVPAYKPPERLRRLHRDGFCVQFVLTPGARRSLPPLTSAP